MKQNYSNYGLNDPFMRTFMMPAVMPNESKLMNQSEFINPEEGFLRGNMEAGTYVPYKNMTFIKPVLNNERQRTLYKLQEIAFAAHELNLYLDTHPNDTNAIKLYNDYVKKERMLNDEYERKYGPID